MNIQDAKIRDNWPRTPDEFLRWNEGREGRREFVNGRVVEMMINVTRTHWMLTNRLVFQFTDQLGVKAFNIGGADFGVRTADGVRYPDVMIEKAGADGTDLAATEPVLIAEILSPSTMRDDFGPKADAYLAMDSLQHYLIVSQDEARIWYWSRGESGGFADPAIATADDGSIALGGLGIVLDLVQLYQGIADNRS